jgi:hypothetical protein
VQEQSVVGATAREAKLVRRSDGLDVFLFVQRNDSEATSSLFPAKSMVCCGRTPA